MVVSLRPTFTEREEFMKPIKSIVCCVAVWCGSMPWAPGCALELPEVSRSHPANTEAPAGQIYATPEVLQVSPIERPPDYPSAAPSGAHGETNGMNGNHDAAMHHHAGMSDDTEAQGTDRKERDRHQVSPGEDGRSLQRMQKEGQRDE